MFLGLPCLHYTWKNAPKMRGDAMKMQENTGMPYRRVRRLHNRYDQSLLGSADILQPTTSCIGYTWKCQTRAETPCRQQIKSLASHVKQCRTPIVSTALRSSMILRCHGRVIRLSPYPAHLPAPNPSFAAAAAARIYDNPYCRFSPGPGATF